MIIAISYFPNIIASVFDDPESKKTKFGKKTTLRVLQVCAIILLSYHLADDFEQSTFKPSLV